MPTAWPMLAHDLQSDAFDIAMGGVSVTLDRQKIGFFSTPYLSDGKTPIARCDEQSKYQTLADIDRPGVRVIVNPGGTNERFDRAHLRQAAIVVQPDNTKIFDALAAGAADVMITDASETRLQEKLHPGALCAIHPDQPFDFSEKAYWMPPDPALKALRRPVAAHREGDRRVRRARRQVVALRRGGGQSRTPALSRGA